MSESKKAKNPNFLPIVLAAVLGTISLFLFAARYIVVDECASPCRHDNPATVVCPAVCVKITLLDWLLGKV